MWLLWLTFMITRHCVRLHERFEALAPGSILRGAILHVVPGHRPATESGSFPMNRFGDRVWDGETTQSGVRDATYSLLCW